MEVGDVVRLKSGGPDMVISETYSPGAWVCKWFNKKGKIETYMFMSGELIPLGNRLNVNDKEFTFVGDRTYPKFCPMCQSCFIVVNVAGWPALSAEDPDNKAVLMESQCRDCSISFWV